MNEKYTPAPWHIEKSIYGQFIYSAQTPICQLHLNEGNDTDAQLIVAAPELLTACKALIKIEPLWVPTLEDNAKNHEECQALVAAHLKIKNAIKKAEGK